MYSLPDLTKRSAGEIFPRHSSRSSYILTIRNYRYHMKNMSNYFDAEKPFDEVTKRDIEAMAVAMRKAGLAHNTIATYNRMLITF